MKGRLALAAVVLCAFASGVVMAKATNPFTDVPAGHYAEEAIAWAVENGITSGCSPTEFCPDDPLTRAEAVTFLHRALVGEGTVSASSQYLRLNACYRHGSDRVVFDWEYLGGYEGRDRFANAVLYNNGEKIDRSTIERFTWPDEFLTIVYDVDQFDMCAISLGFSEIARIEFPVEPGS